jgi:hypothetical protein
MKVIRLSAIVLLSSFLTAGYAQQVIRFSDKRWKIEATGSLVEYYKGYESIYLKLGRATLPEVKFLNGIIEFDLYLTEQASFSGFFFRQQDRLNYEEIYFRPHQSGRPDAFQYTPVFNGISGWQLYHDQYDALNDGFIHWKPQGTLRGFNSPIDFPFDRWVHVKLLVKDNKAELYYNNMNSPVAFIHELLQEQKAGAIGISSSVSAMRFANFSFTATDNIVFNTYENIAITAAPGTITEWQVSNVFKEDLIKNMNTINAEWANKLRWKNLPVEATGLANLSRLSVVSDSANTVFARVTINVDKDQIKKLDIGYSDRVKIYCNGTALYSGNASFRTRDYRYLGTIGYFDAVYLPLKKGENTIMIAVSETFGGWGIMGKWNQ